MPLFDPDAACAAVAAQLGEPTAATAPVATAWLVVEQPGSWGPRGLQDVTDWPEEVRDQLVRRADALDVRIQLVRRTGRRDPTGHRHAWLVHAGDDPWMRAWSVTDPLDLLDIDLAAAHRDAPGDVGGTPTRLDLWLVCTHGRRDACCALLGRPVAGALADADLDGEVWETTHTGGHRFAPNLVHLPSGVTYGRVTPERAVAVARDLQVGRLDLDLYRGRSVHTRAVQAAETFLRRALVATRLDAVAHVATADTWDGHRFVFAVRAPDGRDQRWQVDVEHAPTGVARPVSDGADLTDPGTWELRRVERVA